MTELSKRREREIIKGWTDAFNKLVAYRVALVGLAFHCVDDKALATGAPMFPDADADRIDELLNAAVDTNFEYGDMDKRTHLAVANGVDSVMTAAERIQFHPRPRPPVKRKRASK